MYKFISPILIGTSIVPFANMASSMNELDKNDVSNLDINPTKLNINGLGYEPNTAEFNLYLLMNIASNNISNDESYLAINDAIQNPDNWIIAGYPIRFPEIGNELTYTIMALANSSNQLYSAIMSLKITLNNDDNKDISDLITKTNLGVITNPDKNVIIKKLLV